MSADDYTAAVTAAGRTIAITTSDIEPIAAAIRKVDERIESIFSDKQKVTLAVHLAAFLERVRTGGSLPPLDQSAADEVSDDSLHLARKSLEHLSGAPTTHDEALLVAIHRDAALITRRST